MMDVEKLIKTLRQHGVSCVRACGRYCSICDEAATALSTLQAENSQLRESRDHWKRLAHELSEGVNGKDAEHERLQAENEKLRAEVNDLKDKWDKYQPREHWETLNELCENLHDELEQVKRENNELWTYIEIVDREYRRYMDRGYIDRLDGLRRTWRRGQKED